jgi:hypothetical protein
MNYKKIFIALCFIPLSNALFADATLVFKDGKQASPMLFKVKNGIVRMEDQDPAAQGMSTLFNSMDESMTVMNKQRKEYNLVTEASMKQQMTAMEAMQEKMMEQMEVRLSSMPKEQQQKMRQQIEQMKKSKMTSPAAANIKVEETGKTDVVNGIKCTYSDVYNGDKKIREVCVAQLSEQGVSESDANAVKAMFAFMEKLARMSPMGKNMAKAKITDFKGMPIKIIDIESGDTSSVLKISTESLAETEFKIPEHYKLFDPMKVMQQESGHSHTEHSH